MNDVLPLGNVLRQDPEPLDAHIEHRCAVRPSLELVLPVGKPWSLGGHGQQGIPPRAMGRHAMTVPDSVPSIFFRANALLCVEQAEKNGQDVLHVPLREAVEEFTLSPFGDRIKSAEGLAHIDKPRYRKAGLLPRRRDPILLEILLLGTDPQHE